ncbi:MAG: hypothetical protein ACFE0I_09340 [Elainellaceae cyanobacterium]
MLSQVYYLIRSRADGQYLVARSQQPADLPQAESESVSKFLLLFKEHADALSYLNTHSSGVANRFTVESVPSTQVGRLLSRWDFAGIGVVQDPLMPRIEFLARS